MLPLLLGQFDDSLKSKLQNRSNFTKIKDDGNVLKLVNAIKEEKYVLR